MSVDLLIRAAAVAELAILGVVFVRLFGWTRIGITGLVFLYGVVGYLTCPLAARHLASMLLQSPAFVACFGVGGFFWLFSRCLFDDGFRPSVGHGAVLAAAILLGFLKRLAPTLPAELFGAAPDSLAALLYQSMPQLASLGFVIAALTQLQLGRAGDLVEARRRFRDFLVVIAGAYIIVIALVEIFLRQTVAPAALEVVNVAGIMVVTTFFLTFLSIHRQALGRITERPPAAATDPERPPAAATDPERPALHQALNRAMEAEQAYRDDALTIGALAKRLGTQEYKLRRLINQDLGHRNFNAFANGYRIAEVQRRLGEPQSAHLPILTLALEAGFRSIAPFNRAFKDQTGMTPTEYRRQESATVRTSEP